MSSAILKKGVENIRLFDYLEQYIRDICNSCGVLLLALWVSMKRNELVVFLSYLSFIVNNRQSISGGGSELVIFRDNH